MHAEGIRGGVRGKCFRTTIPDNAAARPLDKVNRQFVATRSNRLWVADAAYLATQTSIVYAACVIDVFARRITGGRLARQMPTDVILDGPERALWARAGTQGVLPHSDRGSQNLSIRYSECLARAGIEPSVGSVGDSYDNTLAESFICLLKTVVIRHRGPWRNGDEVEFATFEWVDWFVHPLLLESIGNMPPAELEMAYYRQQDGSAMAA